MPPRPSRRAIAPDFDSQGAADIILADYQRFLARLEREEAADAKDFAGRHGAGRTALAHLEHLLKIAVQVGADMGADDGLAALLAAARQANNDTDEENESDAGGTG